MLYSSISGRPDVIPMAVSQKTVPVCMGEKGEKVVLVRSHSIGENSKIVVLVKIQEK